MLRWVFLSVPAVLLMPIVNWLTRIWSFQWRQALTTNYLYRWRVICKGRLEVEGVSQRVQEDTHRFARLIDSLGQGFLAACLQLISFSPRLWTLSSGLPGMPDGALLYLSVLGNILGVGVSFLVGYHLVTLEYNNQAVEARASGGMRGHDATAGPGIGGAGNAARQPARHTLSCALWGGDRWGQVTPQSPVAKGDA